MFTLKQQALIGRSPLPNLLHLLKCYPKEYTKYEGQLDAEQDVMHVRVPVLVR